MKIVRPLVDLSKASSIAHWTKKLYCTEAQLQAAVAIVGTREADIRKQLEASTNRIP
jgi:hypothetical protein